MYKVNQHTDFFFFLIQGINNVFLKKECRGLWTQSANSVVFHYLQFNFLCCDTVFFPM